MKIIYKQGDILECEEKFLVQGCNAQGVMGSGLARQIRDRYPEVYGFYRHVYERDGLGLGGMVIVGVGERVLFNAITQSDFGRDSGRLYASYAAIEEVVRRLNDYVKGGAGVAFPLIGCGLANGDWDVVERIIEEGSVTYQPVVYRL